MSKAYKRRLRHIAHWTRTAKGQKPRTPFTQEEAKEAMDRIFAVLGYQPYMRYECHCGVWHIKQHSREHIFNMFKEE